MFNSVGGASISFKLLDVEHLPLPSWHGGPFSGPSRLVGTTGQSGNAQVEEVYRHGIFWIKPVNLSFDLFDINANGLVKVIYMYTWVYEYIQWIQFSLVIKRGIVSMLSYIHRVKEVKITAGSFEKAWLVTRSKYLNIFKIKLSKNYNHETKVVKNNSKKNVCIHACFMYERWNVSPPPCLLGKIQRKRF